MGELPSTNMPFIPGTENIVSPYGSPINTSLSGQVRYTEFLTTHSHMASLDNFILEVTGHDFHATMLMIAFWEDVAQTSTVSIRTNMAF